MFKRKSDQPDLILELFKKSFNRSRKSNTFFRAATRTEYIGSSWSIQNLNSTKFTKGEHWDITYFNWVLVPIVGIAKLLNALWFIRRTSSTYFSDSLVVSILSFNRSANFTNNISTSFFDNYCQFFILLMNACFIVLSILQ